MKKRLFTALCLLLSMLLLAGCPDASDAGDESVAPEDEADAPAIYMVYHKDGTVYWYDFETASAKEITSEMGNEGDRFLRGMISTPNGRYLLYPDKMSQREQHANILVRDMTVPDAQPKTLAKYVTDFFVSDDSDTVWVLDVGKRLYRCSISAGTLEAVAENVDKVVCSVDGKTVLYAPITTKDTTFGRQYYRITDGDTQNAVTFTGIPRDFSPDLSVILYEEGDDLYKLNGEGTVTKVDSDTISWWVGEDGSVYYMKNSGYLTPRDYIINDTGKSFDYTVLEKYPMFCVDVYHYDGQPKQIAENVLEVAFRGDKNNTITYTTVNLTKKVPLSEILEGGISQAFIDRLLGRLCDGVGVVKNGRVSEFKTGYARTYLFSRDYSKVCLLKDVDLETGLGSLYVTELTGSHAGKTELIDKSVSEGIFAGNTLLYIKDKNLYKENKNTMIAENVNNAFYRSTDDMILVCYDNEDEYPSLGVYQSSDSILYPEGSRDTFTELCKDIDKIGFLENLVPFYSDKDGNLYCYTNGTSMKVAEDPDGFINLKIGGSVSYRTN